MKVKTSGRVSSLEQLPQCCQGKRKNECGSLEVKDGAATLITSSSKKQKAGSSRMYRRTKRTKAGPKTDGLAKDAGHDLRLAFSSIDGSVVDNKGVSATPSSILDTIFSPVFHLFKGVNGETSNSCTSSVEQADSSDEKIEDVATRVEYHNVSQPQETSKKYMVSCSMSAAVAADPVTEKAGTFVEVSVPSRIDQLTSAPNSSDEEIFGSQAAFDVDENCIEWSLVDENIPRDVTQTAERIEDGLLDSEGASLYLAIQQTKSLDCNNERSQAEAVADEDELDDFDPYLFIKHLPELSEVVSPSRPPILLPKQTRRCPPITLVLDLDETLVHSTLEHCDDADFTFPVNFNSQEYTVYVRRRPHLQMFMEKVAQLFEIIVFTASQSVYAEQLLNVLDPKRKLIRHRVFRDSCVFVEGNYLKDLTVLGRDLAKVAIVDNSPQAFGFQVDNGIPIESWFDDRADCALAGLLPFLETLVGVDDVRPVIAKKFNLRQKVAAAIDPPSLGNRGDPLERCS